LAIAKLIFVSASMIRTRLLRWTTCGRLFTSVSPEAISAS